MPQKPYLFTGTVASNLRYGDPEATDDELWDALRIAQAEDFVRAMPQGLDSPIAQGGTNVSGGQRQRLAIARALVASPAVFLFDDSFSALDLATDARLRAALRPVTRDATVIVVAQRVSTIVDADQIVVLDDGQVVGHRHARRAARDLSDVPGDRPVPARRRGGGGMSEGIKTAEEKAAEARRGPGAQRRGPGPGMHDRHARRRSRRTSARRPSGCSACCAPSAPSCSPSSCWPSGASRSARSAPRSSATRPTSSSPASSASSCRRA